MKKQVFLYYNNYTYSSSINFSKPSETLEISQKFFEFLEHKYEVFVSYDFGALEHGMFGASKIKDF